jgi:hypothetical protein
MKKINTAMFLALAAGSCIGTAQAQIGTVINISGASLLENYVRSSASTNDFIDVDGDGIAGSCRNFIGGVLADQLATGGPAGFDGATETFTDTNGNGCYDAGEPFVDVNSNGFYDGNRDQIWAVQYRVTGSVNGFNELIAFGSPNAFVTSHAGDIFNAVDFPAGNDGSNGFPANDRFDFTDTNNNGRHDAGEPSETFTDVNGNGAFERAQDVAIAGAAQSSTAPNNTNPGFGTSAYFNRVPYIGNGQSGGGTVGVRFTNYNQGNPGGAPVRSDTTTLLSTFSAPDSPASGGIRIDISPLDVSTFLASRKPGGTPAWDALPGDAGYGTNPVTMVTNQGATPSGALATRVNTLAALGNRNLFDPNNPSAANANTIFDTQILFAPIAPVTNFGTGLSTVTMTQLQHLFGTGRMPSGENLVCITRDSGSGTRNAFNNCIGQDPSFGVGENIGPISTSGNQNTLGATFIPGNKGSNGGMEATLRNVRLGVGVVGTERGVTGSGSGSWLVRDGSGVSALEILSVINNLYGGTVAARPTIQNLLTNNSNGWVIGGQAVLATIGDPRANSAALGGTGWVGAFDPFVDGSNGFPADGVYQVGETFTDLNGNTVRDDSNAEAGLLNSNPAMTNPAAAAYLNNLSRSIAAFNSVPGDLESLGMPGEFAASQFISLAALDNAHSDADYTNLISNPLFNAGVKNYILTTGTNVHFRSEFATANTITRGKVPTRTTGATYSDGVSGTSAFYIRQNGSNANYGSNLDARNTISADFNGDGVRSIADAGDMVAAWRQRQPSGPAWTAPDGIYGAGSGATAIIEVLGDLNGDGNYTRADLRYWADGLALVNGQLDRAAGFEAVDAAFSGNFFGTTKSNTNATWTNGDSRADVSNASGRTTPGHAPIGADRNNGVVDSDDNRIDVSDVNYVLRQFNNAFVTDGAANWSSLDEAVGFDLSADMTGDLIVDQADVTDIVVNVLQTVYGDLNLDGVFTCTEKNTIILGNFNSVTTSGGWGAGDLNGDGRIDTADVALLFGADGVCLGDYNCDGGVDGDDVIAFFADWDNGIDTADLDGSAGVDGDDVIAFFNRWDLGC